MKFILSIDLGNATMSDNHDVAKALHGVADRLSKFTSTGWSPYALDGKIKDENGNTCGTWEVKSDVEWNPTIEQMKPSTPPVPAPAAKTPSLAPADTIHNDPEGGPIMRRVAETFAALAKARTRQSRVSRPEAKKAAAIEYKAADEAYRIAADARDRFVEIWNGRKMQRSVAT